MASVMPSKRLWISCCRATRDGSFGYCPSASLTAFLARARSPEASRFRERWMASVIPSKRLWISCCRATRDGSFGYRHERLFDSLPGACEVARSLKSPGTLDGFDEAPRVNRPLDLLLPCDEGRLVRVPHERLFDSLPGACEVARSFKSPGTLDGFDAAPRVNRPLYLLLPCDEGRLFQVLPQRSLDRLLGACEITGRFEFPGTLDFFRYSLALPLPSNPGRKVLYSRVAWVDLRRGAQHRLRRRAIANCD